MEVLINRLDQVQEQHGWLPEEEIIKVAQEYGIPKAHLYGVISFYSRFYTKPVGEYVVRICKSVACGMNGSRLIRDAVIEAIEKSSEENLFTLELVECLGHCNLSPVMTVNDVVHGNLTPNEAVAIIQAYRSKALSKNVGEE